MSWKEIIIFIIGALFGKVLQDSLPILDARPRLKKFGQIFVVYLFVIYAYLYNVIKGNKNQEQAFALLIASIFLLLAARLACNPDIIKKNKEIQ